MDGQYIALGWDCIDVPPEYVRGHVTPAQFAESMERQGHDFDASKGTFRHGWARFMPDPNGEYTSILHDCKRGRGAFAVTKWER